MKKAQIQIGGRYVARVSNGLTIVRIVSESSYGGWIGRNEETKRTIRIKTAARLRRPARTAIDHLITLPGDYFGGMTENGTTRQIQEYRHVRRTTANVGRIGLTR